MTESRTVQLFSKETRQLHFDLVPESAAPPVVVAPVVAPPAAPAEAEQPIEGSPRELEDEPGHDQANDDPPDDRQGRKKISPAPFWICAGGTVLFAGGAIAANFILRDRRGDLDTDKKFNDAKLIRAGGIASLGLAAAAGVATIVPAFFTDFKGDETQGDSPDDAKLSLGIFGTGNEGGLAVVGSFQCSHPTQRKKHGWQPL